jgi:hypothetical protein
MLDTAMESNLLSEVTLLQDTDVISGKAIKFKPGTEATVKVRW